MRYFARVEQDGTQWVATFPDCPGAHAWSDRFEELATRAEVALEGWLEAQLKDERAAPPLPTWEPGDRVHSLSVEVPIGLALPIRLRRARQERHLTQRQLAEKLGVKQQMVSKLESPNSNPGVDTLVRATKALGVGLDVVLTDRG